MDYELYTTDQVEFLNDIYRTQHEQWMAALEAEEGPFFDSKEEWADWFNQQPYLKQPNATLENRIFASDRAKQLAYATAA